MYVENRFASFLITHDQVCLVMYCVANHPTPFVL